MKFGFVHDEFGLSWKMVEAYPYTDPRAFYADSWDNAHGNIHQMPRALKCDKVPFRPDFDYSNYDVIIFFLQGGRGKTDAEYMHAIKQKYPSTFLILYWGELYRLEQNPEACFQVLFQNELEIMRAVDVVTCNFDYYDRVIGGILSKINKPFRFLPEPYDTEHIFASHKKIERGNGAWTMAHGRSPDISRSISVMGRLQKDFGIDCFVHRYNNISPERIQEIKSKVAPDLKIIESNKFDRYDDFLNDLITKLVVFDDYPCYSGSNLSVSCACAGVPTITHEFNTAGRLCFPTLNFGINDLEKWYQGAVNLIKDENFYFDVMNYARQKAKEIYSFDAVKEYVTKIYEELGK